MSRSPRIAFALSVVFCFCFATNLFAAEEKLPTLPGSSWGLLSLTEKNEKIVDAMSPADVAFLKDNKWSILHATGMLQGGTYELKGDRLTIKFEGGEEYMAGKLTFKAETQILEINSGTWLMRLKAIKAK